MGRGYNAVDCNDGVFNVAIVVSQFNHEITKALQKGAYEHLLQCGFNEQLITIIEVPGAVEIPLVAQTLARSNQFEAIIALGAVIRGDTTHYEDVCQMVSQGCLRVALDFNIPVIYGVLTTENEQQAWDRIGGSHGHKGVDAVDAARSMVSLLKKLASDKHNNH